MLPGCALQPAVRMQSSAVLGNYVLVNQKYILLCRPELTRRNGRSQARWNLLLLCNVKRRRPIGARSPGAVARLLSEATASRCAAGPSARARRIDVLAE